MTYNFFQLLKNYEVQKLHVTNVEFVNVSIWILVIILILLSLKRREKSEFLDKITTIQIRGLAILMVVIGHIWVHVASEKPTLVMSGDGVAFFFLLSGFGLAMSFNKNKPKLREYITQRVNRVMIPYWFSTILILGLDYFILNRTYQLPHIGLTLVGVNVYGIMHHFDYVRWYITFLIFWYIVAYFCDKLRSRAKSAIMIVFVSSLIFPLDYYLFHFGWYQFLAFPVGFVLGSYIHTIKRFNEKIDGYRLFIVLLVIICSFYYKLLLSHILSGYLPSIAIRFISDLNSLIFAFSIIMFFNSLRNYYSRFLMIIGRYSYEIFLLHGVFLIKYNPLFSLGSLVWTFIIFIVFITSLSRLMNKSIGGIRL